MVSMPEAAVHENTSPVLPHHDVRLSWQSWMIQPIAEPMSPQPFAHHHFRLRILAVNGSHVGVALLCGLTIHIRLHFQFSHYFPVSRQPSYALQFVTVEPFRRLMLLQFQVSALHMAEVAMHR